MDLNRPQVMGILNATPDSFYSDSCLRNESDLLRKAEQHLLNGAAFLDIGAFSTRPNGLFVTSELEEQQIEWGVKLLNKHFPHAVLSVDTFRGKVAQKAIDNGASIINDISGFSFDPELWQTLKKNPAITYVLMHLRGDFSTMHTPVDYKNGVTKEVISYFQDKSKALSEIGLRNIILDPGFGFSKTMEDNHLLLRELDQINLLPSPLLVGISRKSMIYKKLNIAAQEALNGTIALNAIALNKGASILRVHDVKEAKELIDLLF